MSTLAIDHAVEVQEILEAHAHDRMILSINGHSHTDQMIRKSGVVYLHLNSASYYWVGSDFQHVSFDEPTHTRYPALSKVCPYGNSLFAVLTIYPVSLTVRLEGQRSYWVGPSPAELGARTSEEMEVIVPEISDRSWR